MLSSSLVLVQLCSSAVSSAAGPADAGETVLLLLISSNGPAGLQALTGVAGT